MLKLMVANVKHYVLELEYDRTKGFSSSAGAELSKTHVRLTEAELLKLKFG